MSDETKDDKFEGMSRADHEKLWTAVSKLESQVCRNPDLPPVYKQIVSDAFEVLRRMQAQPSAAPPLDANRGYLNEPVGAIDAGESAGLADRGEGHCVGTFWSEKEIQVIDALSKKLEMSHVAVIRNALRNYQLVIDRPPNLPDKFKAADPPAQGQPLPLNWVNVLKSVISGTYACHYQQDTFLGKSEPCGECAHCRADKLLGEGWEKSGSAPPQMSARDFWEQWQQKENRAHHTIDDWPVKLIQDAWAAQNRR